MKLDERRIEGGGKERKRCKLGRRKVLTFFFFQRARNGWEENAWWNGEAEKARRVVFKRRGTKLGQVHFHLVLPLVGEWRVKVWQVRGLCSC